MSRWFSTSRRDSNENAIAPTACVAVLPKVVAEVATGPPITGMGMMPGWIGRPARDGRLRPLHPPGCDLHHPLREVVLAEMVDQLDRPVLQLPERLGAVPGELGEDPVLAAPLSDGEACAGRGCLDLPAQREVAGGTAGHLADQFILGGRVTCGDVEGELLNQFVNGEPVRVREEECHETPPRVTHIPDQGLCWRNFAPVRACDRLSR